MVVFSLCSLAKQRDKVRFENILNPQKTQKPLRMNMFYQSSPKDQDSWFYNPHSLSAQCCIHMNLYLGSMSSFCNLPYGFTYSFWNYQFMNKQQLCVVVGLLIFLVVPQRRSNSIWTLSFEVASFIICISAWVVVKILSQVGLIPHT